MELASTISALLAKLAQQPLVQQVAAGFESVWGALVSSWTKWAPVGVQNYCSSACKAVSAMDSPEDGGLRKGDQVVVRSPFIAESGTIFGTRLQKNMKGLVEEVHADGGALVQFAGHLGRFPVMVPLELQSNLQVETADGHCVNRAVPGASHKTRLSDCTGEHKRAVLAFGTSLIFFVVMSLAIHTGQGRAPECTKEYLDCRETLLCCDPTHSCYEKTDMWAACLPNCTS